MATLVNNFLVKAAGEIPPLNVSLKKDSEEILS